MNRAKPSEIRAGIESAKRFTQYGIRFVPIPALNDQDYQELIAMVNKRLEQLAKESEKDGEQ